jgi:hypothetical protein
MGDSMMTPTDFAKTLAGLAVGEAATVPYAVYEILFPPGEPDQRARDAAHAFARKHGCEIENRLAQQEVLFIRRITHPT